MGQLQEIFSDTCVPGLNSSFGTDIIQHIKERLVAQIQSITEACCLEDLSDTPRGHDASTFCVFSLYFKELHR